MRSLASKGLPTLVEHPDAALVDIAVGYGPALVHPGWLAFPGTGATAMLATKKLKKALGLTAK